MKTVRIVLAVSLGSLLLGTVAAGQDPRRPMSSAPSPFRTNNSSSPSANDSDPKGKPAPPRPGAARRGSSPLGPSGSGSAHQVTPQRDGSAIHRDSAGRVVEVHTPRGHVIWHSPDGIRHFEWPRPDGSVIVAHGRGGYIQRSFESRGEPFVQRTYIHAGIASRRFYRPWTYEDTDFHFYAHSHTYRPGVYGWAASAFQHPVAYGWGWEGSPWYALASAYFRPDPVYLSPAAWLADYTLGATLASAYLPSYPADAIPMASALTVEGPPATMPPGVKRALADEIRREMNQLKTEVTPGEQAQEGGWSLPEIFTDHGPRVFLVAARTTGLTQGNAEIQLSEGDVLGLVDTPDPRDATTRVKVLSASGPGCPWGSVLMVNTENLVESLNQMQATIDQGLEKLQADRAKSGKGPAAFPLPPADAGKDAAFMKDARAEPRAVADFTSAAKEADLDEKAALALAKQVEAPKKLMPMTGFDDQDRWAAAAAQVKVNMDVEEVDRLLGRPERLASGLGKKTYFYIDGHMKINFIEDKVTEIIRW